MVITHRPAPEPVWASTSPDGNFFPDASRDLLGELSDVHAATLAVGDGSSLSGARDRRRAAWSRRCRRRCSCWCCDRRVGAARPAGARRRRGRQDTHTALPDPAIPDVGAWPTSSTSWRRRWACSSSAPRRSGSRAGWRSAHGYDVDPDRDLVAIGRRERARRPVIGIRPVGRREPDRRGRRRGRRSQLASLSRRVDTAHRRVPGAAVRGPAAGGAGGDRGSWPSPASSTSPSCGGSTRVRRSAIVFADDRTGGTCSCWAC